MTYGMLGEATVLTENETKFCRVLTLLLLIILILLKKAGTQRTTLWLQPGSLVVKRKTNYLVIYNKP